MFNSIFLLLLQNNPMGFPDWYFTLLGGSSAPNYEAIIRMQEKMYGAAKIIFIVSFIVAILLYSFQASVGVKISPKEMILSFCLTLFVMICYNQIFSYTIDMSVTIGEAISSREDREDWGKTIREKADDRTGANKSWSAFNGKLGILVSWTLGGAPQAIGVIMVACAGIVFLIAVGVIWALWVILIMALFAFGPILVAFGVVPNWGTRILSSWFNALVLLGVWNVYNSMCIWLMITSCDLFYQASGANDPNSFSSGMLLTTGGMTVVYTVLLIAGPILINSLLPLGSFLGIGSFGVEKGAQTFAGAVSGGASGVAGAFGSGSGSSNGNSGGGGGEFERHPTKPENV